MRKHQKINLIPASHKAPPPVSLDQLIQLSIVVFLVFCSGHYYLGYRTALTLDSEANSIKDELADADKKIQEATATITASTVLDEQEKLVRKVVAAKPNWGDAFKELSLVVPQETWLSQLVLRNNAGQLEVSIKGETSSQANMADFLASLEKSEFFNNILMISSKISEQTTPPLYSFEFAAPALASKGQASR